MLRWLKKCFGKFDGDLKGDDADSPEVENQLTIPLETPYPSRRVILLIDHPYMYEEFFVPCVNQALKEYIEVNKEGKSFFKASNNVHIQAVPVETVGRFLRPVYFDTEDQELD